MKAIVTRDNSITFHNEQYNETYHAVSGGVEEAFGKFVGPCKIEELARTGSIKMLDVCFGLGYNTIAAIDKALEVNPDCVIEVVGLEIDSIILNKIPELSPCLKHYNLLKEITKNKATHKIIQERNITITLIVGDAREEVRKLHQEKNYNNCFDAVFFDPFSPKKHPEMWEEAFFKDIFKTVQYKGRLATFSCARVARENLKNVGFTVHDGPSVGRRAPSTIAIKE
jgi:tRNA U34 5-methylaminomethyl-2-thiouridine-forming methyltransferase MnmC